MKTFVNPVMNSSDVADPEGDKWLKCIRTAQVFLICLSFTVIHHITNPLGMSDDALTMTTAALSAVESAFLVIFCTLFCISKRPKGELPAVVKKYSLNSAHPTSFSVHPVYFI